MDNEIECLTPICCNLPVYHRLFENQSCVLLILRGSLTSSFYYSWRFKYINIKKKTCRTRFRLNHLCNLEFRVIICSPTHSIIFFLSPINISTSILWFRWVVWVNVFFCLYLAGCLSIFYSSFGLLRHHKLHFWQR